MSDKIEILDIDVNDLAGTNMEPSYDPWDDIIDKIDNGEEL